MSALTSWGEEEVPSFLCLVGPRSNSNQPLAGLSRQSGTGRDPLEAGLEDKRDAGQLMYTSCTDQSVRILPVWICQIPFRVVNLSGPHVSYRGRECTHKAGYPGVRHDHGVVCHAKVILPPNILMSDCGMANHSLPSTTMEP